ncbi:hypothetical protein GALL_166420 [mine drainage metagenome]|uniref:Outer membrane protein beta-barrel domain-containing protein n=1 Tax=mine drainage metagenome TaxID=410659 RepID=A0A1J5RZS3_9ZZZZ
MAEKIKLGIIAALLMMNLPVTAQKAGKVFFTTAAGLIDAQGRFADAFKSTVTFNSGVELTMKHNWYGQFVLDYNALKYDQQIGDANSPFLFQNTNSSLLLLGLNGGKNFYFKNPKWFTSLYAGGGYLNIGEPRVTVNNSSHIAIQETVRKSSVFARSGVRLAYITKSKFFQTIYLDASYFSSPATIQGGNVNGFALYFGTRFGTIQ